MTDLLKKAFGEAAKLDQPEQEAFARWLLDELASERRWDEAMSQSQDTLSHLAADALTEQRAGRTQPLDPDRL